jgi:hypothetical protein
VTPQQRKAVEKLPRVCEACGQRATVRIIWEFVDTLQPGQDGVILVGTKCDEHAPAMRAQKPQAPANIHVVVTEEKIGKAS